VPTFLLSNAEANRVTITVSDQVTHTMAEGLGFNWFSTYDAATYPSPEEDARWEKVLGHLTFLNANFIRFGQSALEMSDEKGSFVPGHWSFDQFRRLNAWAEERGVNVIADTWYIPEAFQFRPWPDAPYAWGVKGLGYLLGVEDIDGYVSRFVVPYLKYVTEEMGCRSVRWYNHFNEPLGGSGQCATPPPIDDHAHYVKVLAAIRQGLDEAGLGHIGSMGPDTPSLLAHANPLPHMLEIGADPDPHLQAYCVHHYHSHFDWDQQSTSNQSDSVSYTINERVAPECVYAHARGKPYLITELGMFHYGWRWGDPMGIARHDNALLEAEFAIRAMGKGADCMLRWAWLNPGTRDGWWQLVNTADGSDAPVRDSYHSYATLMRYVGRQAKVLATEVSSPTSSQTVHAVAVKNGDGRRTLLVVNDSYANCAPVLVRFPVGSAVRKIVNDPVRKHEEVEEIAVNGGAMERADVLSPMSLTVYTTA
jgi:hypothetical protein